MKYIVMECHEGYAVLMDEASRFVHAANLHYQVGQTVCDPMLLSRKTKASSKPAFILTRIAAAAACLAIVSGVGYGYYAKNIKTYSTVLLSSEADIRMGLNKKGEVIYLKSVNDRGEEILKNYNGKGKDKITVANEILEIEMSKGLISSGDTVDLYISAENSDDYVSIKDDFENSISSGLNLKIKVLEPQTPPKKHEPEEPVPPHDISKNNKLPDVNGVEPPKAAEPKESPMPPHENEAAPPVHNAENADIPKDLPVPPPESKPIPEPSLHEKPDVRTEHEPKEIEEQDKPSLPQAPEAEVPEQPELPQVQDKVPPAAPPEHEVIVPDAGHGILPKIDLKSSKPEVRPPEPSDSPELPEPPVIQDEREDIQIF